MMRRLKLLLWFCFGLVLGGASSYAFAETIAATPVPNQKESRCINPINGGASWDWRAQVGASNNSDCVAAGYNGYYSDWNGCATPMLNRACTWSGRTVTLYQCPSGQNWTLSGTNCTRPDCEAGETRQPDGTCKKQCPASGANTSGVTGTPQGGTGTMPGTLCIGGCSYDYGGVAVQVGNEWAAVAGRATGASCSTSATGSNGTPTTSDPPATPKPQSAADCIGKGQGFGTINGTVVCTGPADATTKKDTKTESVTRPDGSTGTSSTTSTTVCNVAGSCTTTTTTNVSGGGITGSAPNGTTTGTKTQDIVSFCQENSTAPQCKTNEQEDYCKSKPDAVGCKDLGTAPQADPVQTQDKGIGNITQYTTAAGSCPADVALPHGAAWDFGPVCDLAQSVRPIVIALGWLFAGLMIFGYFRS